MWGVRETCEEMREGIGERGVEIFRGWRGGDTGLGTGESEG